MRRIGAVILAAGASRRLGEPKQLGKVGAENLLERSVRVAHEVGFSPVIVVLGASAESIEAACELGDAEVLINESWNEGMGASVRVGVGALRDVDGCVLMTCDMPAVTPTHLRTLSASGEVTGSAYAGRRGVPAYFPASSFDDLMKLRGDAGAKDLLRSAPCVALAGGELDVDTIEDLERARALFG
ncbi:nucleotidyltransferase family protein [Tunturibacter empetritectus]|uniref:CTP:molybdopterin cytidylyltransferase MocA n=1 Tax=Tunturiibacter lichenicola TaxID=2051959 RepID=A0A7W8JCR1_9BACT|nr:nucleotidyltransferase family protein [Edaphobacter lichenicola]MBB5345449.1 CTP:molybdopterin cytidylyltransferase MocA [Edaphobacter lichenicola]